VVPRREAATRHWPQSRQIVAPLATSAAGQRIEGMFARPPLCQDACSVSREQEEQ
jgi:hypothetical protein